MPENLSSRSNLSMRLIATMSELGFEDFLPLNTCEKLPVPVFEISSYFLSNFLLAFTEAANYLSL